jgi:DNA-binding transcriptional MocR family regulator
MERSYAALREMLRNGQYRPGQRLEANRIADEIGVSMTPVRDALNRLVGEQLVEASSGEGFHVPRYSEGTLRDLYEWHSALITIAARTGQLPLPPIGEPDEIGGASLADMTVSLFERYASIAPNREIRAAVANVGDRLHPFRLLESQVLDPMIGELEELEAAGSGLLQAIRRYHLRRMKVIPALLQLRDDSSASSRL